MANTQPIDDLHILESSVMQSMQGQGLGRGMVEAAKDYARSKRLRFITLTTFKNVAGNAPFYSRIGSKAATSADFDQRLEAILHDEYKHGLAPED